MLLAAVLAALIVPNGAVAALVPMTVVLAVGLGRSPSALLMPMAFGAHAGSLLLLTGTPINVIVSEAAAEAGVGAFGFFEYALVGVPLVVGTIVIVVLFGPRLLPERTPNSIPPNLSDYARTMLKHYSLPEGQVRLRVERGSPLVGMDRAALDLSTYPGVTLAGVHAGGGGRPSGERFLVDDVLVVQGDTKSIRRLADTAILAPSTDVAAAPFEGTTTLMSGEVGVAELVVRPRSAAIGMPVFPGMVTSSGDLVILAIQRQGEDLRPEDGGLAAGDTLLVQGTWAALEANKDDADVLVVDSPEIVRAQAIPLGPGAGRTIGVLLAMVLLLALGVVPPAVAGLLAACGLVLLRVRTMTQAYRAINWTVVVLVGGMIPLSHALQDTGAADQIVQALGHVVGEAGPYPLLIGLLLVCAILGQLISNTATALVVIPITVSAAAAFGVSARGLRGRPADTRGDAWQFDGDGAGWLQVRGLLEARTTHSDLVHACRGALGSADLALLTQRLRSNRAATHDTRIFKETQHLGSQTRSSRSIRTRHANR
jgi:di/tricarboxylate transporter